MSDTGALRVYYDGACPVCRRDRTRYERWAGEAGEAVHWCDVTEHRETLRAKGVDPQAALLSLHVPGGRFAAFRSSKLRGRPRRRSTYTGGNGQAPTPRGRRPCDT